MASNFVARIARFDGQFETPYGLLPRQETRDRLCEAQNWRCCYCGEVMTLAGRKRSHGSFLSDASLEHLTPGALGGGDLWENCVAACCGCNSSRPLMMPALSYWEFRQISDLPRREGGRRAALKEKARVPRILVPHSTDLPRVAAYLELTKPGKVIPGFKIKKRKPAKPAKLVAREKRQERRRARKAVVRKIIQCAAPYRRRLPAVYRQVDVIAGASLGSLFPRLAAVAQQVEAQP